MKRIRGLLEAIGFDVQHAYLSDMVLRAVGHLDKFYDLIIVDLRGCDDVMDNVISCVWDLTARVQTSVVLLADQFDRK